MNNLYPYIVLGLETESVSDEEVRRAYLERIRAYPPDIHPDRFQEIHSAYECINTEKKRLLRRYETACPDWAFLPEMLPETEAPPLASRSAVVRALRQERMAALFPGETP